MHWVVNPNAEVATSVHVYSPPLQTMDFFESTPDLSFSRLRTESADAPRTGLGELARRSEGADGSGGSRRARHRGPVSAVDDLLTAARGRLVRVTPHEAAAETAQGALLVDTRPAELRGRDGEIPGAVIIERNVLEWRLDPTSEARIPEVRDHDVVVIVVCDEGYASSLAAASLLDLGLRRATDLDGGFQAWRAAGLPVDASVDR